MAVFKRGDSETYYFKIRFGGRQYLRSANTHLKSEAKVAEHDFIEELKKEAGKPVAQNEIGPAPLFRDYAAPPREATGDEPAFPGGEFWTGWALQRYWRRPRTLAYYQQRMTSLLRCEELANTPLDRINKNTITTLMSWCLSKENNWRNRTINANFAVLRKILNAAIESGVIVAHPKFPKKLKEVRRGLAVTPEHEEIYLRSCPADLKIFYLLMVDTSVEPGTLAEMPWSDIQWGNGKDSPEFGSIYGRCQKSESRARAMPMSERLAAAMRERWMSMGRPTTGVIFPSTRKAKGEPSGIGKFQCAHIQMWKRKTSPITIPYFRLYDLRHTCATRLVEDGGADIFSLKQAMGWENYDMALIYVHGSNRGKFAAYDKLNTSLKARLAATEAAAS